jgi:hypothetical protein
VYLTSFRKKNHTFLRMSSKNLVENFTNTDGFEKSTRQIGLTIENFDDVKRFRFNFIRWKWLLSKD